MPNSKRTASHAISKRPKARSPKPAQPQAEQRQPMYEQDFMALAENAPDIVVRFDKAMRHLYINLAAERATGIPRPAFIGKTNHELGAPEELTRLWEAAGQAVFDSGQEKIIEYAMPTPLGLFYYEARVVPEFAPDGSVETLLVISRDITARKQAEAALRQSEAQYRALIDNSPDYIARFDCEARLLLVNLPLWQSLQAHVPVSANEIVGHTYRQLGLPAEQCDECEQKIQHVVTMVVPLTTEYTYAVPDGVRVYEWRLIPEFDETGQVVSVLSQGRDITARKQLEEKLRESEKAYRDLVDNIPDPVAIMAFEAPHHLLLSNPAHCQMFGYTQEELQHLGPLELDAPDKAPPLTQVAEQLRRTGQLTFETVHVSRAGKHIPAEVNARLVHYQGHLAVLGVSRDLTERKQLEEKLCESEERFRQVAKNASEWIWEVDRNGKYTYSSSGLQQILGYSPDEVVQQMHFYDFFEPQSREALTQRAFQAFAKKEPFKNFVNVSLHKDGRECILTTSGVPILDGQNNLLGYRGVDTDITARKQAEKALRESEARLKTVTDNTADVIVQVDRYGLITYANRLLAGLTAEQVIGLSVYQWTSEEQYPVLTRVLHAAFFRGERGEYELSGPGVSMADAPRLYHMRVVPVMVGGETVSAICTATDITERKQAEAALRASELKFRALAESTPAVTVIIQGEKIVYANPYTTLLSGYSNAELCALSFFNLIHPDYRAQVGARLQARLGGQDDSQRYELPVFMKTGEVRWIAFSATVIEHEGQPAVLATASDVTARKQAEEALRASEERFRRLIDTSPDAIAVTDLNGQIVLANQQAAGLYGFENVEATLGQNAFDYIAPEDRQRAVENAHRTLASGGIRNVEYHCLKKDGARFMGETSVSVLADAAGQPAALIGITRDITARKQAEEEIHKLNARLEERVRQRTWQLEAANRELRQSEERYRTLAEISPDAIVLTNLTGEVMYANPQTLELYGYTDAQEILGRNALEQIAPEDRPRAAANLQITLEKRLTSQVEYTLLRKDGSSFVGELTAALIRQADGSPWAFIGVTRDITVRQQAEAALRASEEKYRMLFEQATDGIVLADSRGNVVDVNTRGCQMLGYTHDEILHLDLRDLIAPEDLGRMLARMPAFGAGQSFIHEGQVLCKDGSRLNVELSGKQLPNGLLQGFVRDIMARKQMEFELRQLNDELEQRVAARTRDLTALYAIASTANLALDLPDMLGQMLRRVEEAVGAPAGAIHLLDETGSVLELMAHIGLASEEINAIRQLPPSAVPAELTSTRAPDGVTLSPDRAYWGVPLQAGEQKFGMISLFGNPQQSLGDEMVSLFIVMADQISAAVETARLRQQVRQAAVLEERQRLARELHDSVNQSLYALANYTIAVRDLLQAGKPEGARLQLDKMEAVTQETLREMRLLIYELRPSILEAEGLANALRHRLEVVEQHVGLRTRLVVQGADQIPAALAVELYGMAQEALNNTLKHAAATEVTVQIDINDERVLLDMADNGRGFDPHRSGQTAGLGLMHLHERAARLGGKVDIISAPGEGTRVRVQVPASGVKRQPSASDA